MRLGRVAYVIDEPFAARQSGFDAVLRPGLVNLSQQVAWGRPCLALTPLARVSDESEILPARVLGPLDESVWTRADHIANANEDVRETRNGIGLGVGSDSIHDAARKPVVGLGRHRRP